MSRPPRQERQIAAMRALMEKAQNAPHAGKSILGGGEMTAGEWEICGWLTNPRAPDMKISEQVHTQRLDKVGAMFPVSRIIFGEFYRGSSPEHITFEEGVIEGHLNQGAVAPFPKHTQDVRGSYANDRFSLKIKMPLGEGFIQVVEGRLVKPLD
ncbi:MAG: hypothetical protein AAF251_03005 [Pseudomonadota bacterium]